MSAHNRTPERDLNCQDCTPLLQDYLDGTLPKTESLVLFLHIRECEPCRERLESWRALFQSLGELPMNDVPAADTFDARVLSAVPYRAYREMEPIRRDRVPVYLEEEFLPASLRSRTTRFAGLVMAGVGAVGLAIGSGPAPLEAVALLGVVPETLLLLQRLGRKMAATGRRSEI